MARKSLTLLLMLIILIFSACQSTTQTEEDSEEISNDWSFDYSILVKVINNYTGTPIEGAIVQLRAGAGIVHEIVTDENGEYLLEDKASSCFDAMVCNVYAAGFDPPERTCCGNCGEYIASTYRRVCMDDNVRMTVYLSPAK